MKKTRVKGNRGRSRLANGGTGNFRMHANRRYKARTVKAGNTKKAGKNNQLVASLGKQHGVKAPKKSKATASKKSRKK